MAAPVKKNIAIGVKSIFAVENFELGRSVSWRCKEYSISLTDLSVAGRRQGGE
jgi:hypothetical protein